MDKEKTRHLLKGYRVFYWFNSATLREHDQICTEMIPNGQDVFRHAAFSKTKNRKFMQKNQSYAAVKKT